MKILSSFSLTALFLLSTSLSTHYLHASAPFEDPEDKKNISKASSIILPASTSLGDHAAICEIFPSHQHYPQLQETFLNLASLFDYDKLPIEIKSLFRSRKDKPFLKIIEECEPNDRVNLLYLLKDILLSLADNNDSEKVLLRFDILDKLQELKAPHFEKLQAFFPLFSNVLSTFNEGQTLRKDISYLFQMAGIYSHNYSPEQLKIIAMHTVSLIEKLKPKNNFGYLLTAITDAIKISPRKLPNVIDLVIPILKGPCFENAHYSSEIISQLLRIKDDQDRHNIAKHCIYFNHSSNVAKVPEHLEKVDISERDTLVSSVQELSTKFNDAMPFRSYETTDIDLMKLLTPLPASKRALAHKRLSEVLDHKGLKELTSVATTQLLHQGEILATLSEESWHHVLPHSITLLRYGMYFSKAASALEKLPSQSQAESITRYASLLNKGRFNPLILLDSELFSIVASISAKTWQEIEPYASQFIAQYNDHAGLPATLEILNSVEGDKSEIFQSLLALCEHSESIGIHRLIASLPVDEIKLLPPFIKELFEHANQVLTGSRTPQQRQLEDQRTINYKQDLVTGFRSLPTPFRSNFSKVTAKVLPKTRNFPVDTLYHLPFSILSQVAHFADQEETLPKAIMCLHNFHEILPKFSDKEKEILCQSAPYLTLNIPGIEEKFDSSHTSEKKTYAYVIIKRIIKTLSSIEPIIRNNILNTYANYFSIQQFGQDEFFQALRLIPHAQLPTYLKETQAHLNNNPNGFLWSDILIAQHQMNNYLEQASSNYDLEYVQSIKNKYISFLLSLSSSDPTQNLMENYAVNHLQKQQRHVLMDVLGNLPLPILERSIDRLQKMEHPLNTQQEIIHHLRTENIIDVPALTNSWAEILRTNPNTYRVFTLVNFITQHFTLFNLTEEDDIVQAAIRAGITLSTADQPLNPYNIFKKLEEKRAQTVDWQAIRPTVETFAGTQIHYNPKFFEDDLRQHVITFAELPSYSKTFLRDSIAAMDERVRTEPQIIAKIKEMSTVDYATLKANSLKSNVLENLLSKTGKSHEKVPVVVARLIAIVSYLESLSNDRGENTFSEKEEGFLRMLASIQACSVGIHEGIHAYYLNILPSQYRYSRLHSQNEGDMAYLRSKQEAITVLAEEIDKMFSGNNYFMKQLVGIAPNGEVMQSSHQGQYLKNLIGHSLGLPDQLLFDAHTHTLYVNLVQLSKQEALATFFKYFVPHLFLDRICNLWDLEQHEAIDSLIDMVIFKKIDPVASSSTIKP